MIITCQKIPMHRHPTVYLSNNMLYELGIVATEEPQQSREVSRFA